MWLKGILAGQSVTDRSSGPRSQAFPQLFLADVLDAVISPWWLGCEDEGGQF